MSKSSARINLALVIASDIVQHPWRVLLYALVMLSAAAVILSSHHNRQLIIVHESLMQERDKLDVEWRHLLLEQSALTEHNRIENLVEKKLDMRRPDPNEEVVVRIR